MENYFHDDQDRRAGGAMMEQHEWSGEIDRCCDQCGEEFFAGDKFIVDEGGSFIHADCFKAEAPHAP